MASGQRHGRVRSERAELRRPSSTVVRLAVAGLVAFGIGAGQGPPAGAEGGTTAQSGVYTEEQAERGSAVFAARCAGCHGADMSGGFGPRLAPLDPSWHELSVASLFRFVSRNMPYDAPGSLQPAEYADVLAHLLASNGFPAGEAELEPDEERLESITIGVPPVE